MTEGYLGLGSNVGDRHANLRLAAERIDAHPAIGVTARSSVYETQPVGEITEQPDFLNVVLRIGTTLAPLELLDACKRVERDLGREPGGVRHGPRPIDVDVLMLDGVTFESERLRLPHPELASRRFVIVPLLEIAPHLELPELADDGQRVERVGPL